MTQRGSHSPRSIVGIKWASLCERPNCIPAPKSQKGAKAAGLRYERQFAKQFPYALHGQWLEYEDRHGRGYCQPDLILSLLPKCLIVFEIKYTLTKEAFLQLSRLYLPVVQAAMNAPVIGCVVAKNLVSCLFPNPVFITPSLDDVIRSTQEGMLSSIPVLHWVGQSLVGQYVRHTHPLKFKPAFEPFSFRFPTKEPHINVE